MTQIVCQMCVTKIRIRVGIRNPLKTTLLLAKEDSIRLLSNLVYVVEIVPHGTMVIRIRTFSSSIRYDGDCSYDEDGVVIYMYRVCFNITMGIFLKRG